MICVRVGDNCLKYLERGSNRKEGREHIDFKKGGGQAGSRGGFFKKGGATGTPLRML